MIAIVSAIISGLVIGLIEETLFRGLLQTQLSAATNTLLAVVIVSIIYSSVHFLQAPSFDPSQLIHWNSGFIILFPAFANLSDLTSVVDSWIALSLAEIFLSLVQLRTNNILRCADIHAG